MLPLAGQTAGPNGLKFFVNTHGWLGGVLGNNNKISNIFLTIFFSHGQRRALQLVYNKSKKGREIELCIFDCGVL